MRRCVQQRFANSRTIGVGQVQDVYEDFAALVERNVKGLFIVLWFSVVSNNVIMFRSASSAVSLPNSISFIGMNIIMQAILPNRLADPPPLSISSCYRLFLLDCSTERSDSLRYLPSAADLLVVMGRLFLIALI